MIQLLHERRLSVFLFLTLGLFLPVASMAQVNFTMSGYTPNGCRPQNITFTASAPVGTNSYTWDFNDGTAPQTTGSVTISHNFTHGGNFQIHLQAFNGGAKQGDSFQNVYVNGINANLYSTMDSACVGEQVSFYANGNINNFQWNFGDPISGANNTSSNSQPSHNYNSPGTYKVVLKSNTSCGMDSVMKTIVVSNTAKPNKNFNFMRNNCPGDPVMFSPSDWHAQNVSWNFGDPASGGNNTSTSQNATHVYTTVGKYAVTFTITNPCGQTASKIDTVQIQTGMTWGGNNFNVNIYRNNNNNGGGGPSPLTGCPGDNFDLYTQATAASYTWNFGDGTPTASTQSVSHSYAANGTYTLSLDLQNGCGNDTIITRTVTIGGTAFGGNPGIDVSSNPACPNGKIIFQSKQSGKAFLWNFGDGITSTLQAPTHVYSTTGVKNISLQITNNCNLDTIVYYSLTISNSVVPSLSMNGNNGGGGNWGVTANTGCPGDLISIYTYGGYSYHVDFGDGYSTNQTFPLVTANGTYDIASHAYSALGTFKIKLTYFNSCGNSAKDSAMVTIGNAQPITNAKINLVDNPPFFSCQPIKILGTGGNKYLWDFGNGDTLIRTNPIIQYAYSTPGNYTITMTVFNGCGDSAILTQNISINNIPSPMINKSGDTLISSPASSYQWMLNGSNIAGATNRKYVAAVSGSYDVVITNNNGCTATGSFLNCFVKASGDVGICPGASAQLNAMGADNYSWSPSTGLSDPSIANPAANPGSDTKYFVTGTTAGCPDVMDSLTVSNITSLTANAGPDLTICSGSSIVINGSGGGDYSWTPTVDLSSYSVANPTVTRTSPITYTLTVSSGTCTSSDQVTINVDPVPTVTVGSDQTICSDAGSVALTGSSTNAAGVIWSSTGTGAFSPNATTANATYNLSGSDQVNSPVTLTLTTNGSGVCPAASKDMMVTITQAITAMAGPDQNISASNTTLAANLSSGTGAWTVASGTAAFANSSDPLTSVTGLANGVNKLVWTITNGVCTASSDTVMITTTVTGITNSVIQLSSNNVYPNPFNEEVNIKFSNIQSGTVLIKITDLTGKVVKTFEHDTANDLKFGNDLNTGMYSVQIIYGDHVEVTRIVKM
jgi:PKD repeat protein